MPEFSASKYNKLNFLPARKKFRQPKMSSGKEAKTTEGATVGQHEHDIFNLIQGI